MKCLVSSEGQQGRGLLTDALLDHVNPMQNGSACEGVKPCAEGKAPRSNACSILQQRAHVFHLLHLGLNSSYIPAALGLNRWAEGLCTWSWMTSKLPHVIWFKS